MFASGKASGYDNILIRVIKHPFHLISAPLTNIINLFLQKSIFPDKLELAKVIPIYNANDPSLFTNYRPISLLSNFSKFFEKVMYNRITEFVEQYLSNRKRFPRLHLRDRKHFPCFYRVIETRVDVWENEKEMLWEHEPQASVSTAFSSSPKPSRYSASSSELAIRVQSSA